MRPSDVLRGARTTRADRALRAVRRRRRRSPAPTALLLGVGAGAAAAFALLARRVARHETDAADAQVRRQVPRKRGPRIVRRAAEAIGPLGKPWVHGPLAALVASFTRPRSRAGAAAITLSSGASAATSRLFERTFFHRPAPPGKREDRHEPSFPSGHALETSAVALTTAYVLVREGRADAWVAAPVAVLLPVVSGLGRMYMDRHWATDVVGGWLAGAAVAACCAAAYEGMPD